MIKVYKAESHVGISVKMPNGKYTRVSFISSSEGSYYQTDNKIMQQALEKHEYYGSVFRCVQEIQQKKETKQENKVKHEEINVSSLVEARDVLLSRGADVSAARNKESIEKTGKEHGIIFIWTK